MASKLKQTIFLLTLSIFTILSVCSFQSFSEHQPALSPTTSFEQNDQIPVTAKSDGSTLSLNGNVTASQETSNLLSQEDFIKAVSDGKAGVIKGAYTAEHFALRVVQQPSGNPGFVSPIDGVATQFGMAASAGVTGLMAHNFASGRFFFNLTDGNIIDIIFGDGIVKSYKVTTILKFQALQPNNSNSDFVNLATNEKMTAAQVFSLVYGGAHHLTLQTCIAEGSVDSWGRLFILAEPV